MNEYDVKRLALVLAIQAEIEGMKIHNKKRVIDDKTDSLYLQSHFDKKAEELRIVASKHNQQL